MNVFNEKGFDWSCVISRGISVQIKYLKTIILTLQNDNQTLKDIMLQMSTFKSLKFEGMIWEVKGNILFGKPEQNQDLFAEEQSNRDKLEVDRLMKSVDKNVNER